MQCNGNFKQWFNIFLIISEAWQGYESKAYGVSNHNLKLQSKKLSRTRDIPNFPTQGWADTAFCTRKRSETYIFFNYVSSQNWRNWLPGIREFFTHFKISMNITSSPANNLVSLPWRSKTCFDTTFVESSSVADELVFGRTDMLWWVIYVSTIGLGNPTAVSLCSSICNPCFIMPIVRINWTAV